MLTRKQEIERSIITRFRKDIWRPFTKAIRDYQLIQEGDKIAVCISGGKDSMLLAKCMEELKKMVYSYNDHKELVLWSNELLGELIRLKLNLTDKTSSSRAFSNVYLTRF